MCKQRVVWCLVTLAPSHQIIIGLVIQRVYQFLRETVVETKNPGSNTWQTLDSSQSWNAWCFSTNNAARIEPRIVSDKKYTSDLNFRKPGWAYSNNAIQRFGRSYHSQVLTLEIVILSALSYQCEFFFDLHWLYQTSQESLAVKSSFTNVSSTMQWTGRTNH